MIRHCVMFRWKDGVDDGTRATIADGLDRLAELDCVHDYRHGPDLGLRDGNWDYVVVGDFVDEAAYRAYADDETHQALIAEHITPNLADRAAVQYELDR